MDEKERKLMAMEERQKEILGYNSQGADLQYLAGIGYGVEWADKHISEDVIKKISSLTLEAIGDILKDGLISNIEGYITDYIKRNLDR